MPSNWAALPLGKDRPIGYDRPSLTPNALSARHASFSSSSLRRAVRRCRLFPSTSRVYGHAGSGTTRHGPISWHVPFWLSRSRSISDTVDRSLRDDVIALFHPVSRDGSIMMMMVIFFSSFLGKIEDIIRYLRLSCSLISFQYSRVCDARG